MTTLVLCLCVFNLAVFTARSVASHGGKHSPRYLTAAKLNRGLAGTPLHGLGFKLEAAGYRWKISPFFMAAISATESSLGRELCNNNPKNIWGLASCTNSWPVPYFETWREAFHFFGRFLVKTWPGARTPHDFHGYAASSTWAYKTTYFMRALFGVGPSVRYP